jgi:hypothetical protein
LAKPGARCLPLLIGTPGKGRGHLLPEAHVAGQRLQSATLPADCTLGLLAQKNKTCNLIDRTVCICLKQNYEMGEQKGKK